MRAGIFTAVLLLLVAIASAQDRRVAQVISPEQHLGRPVGADFHLVAWAECSDYFRKLAEQSPHVRLSVEGKTTEGRDMLVAVISSQSNLNNLERLKAFAKIIADPRETTEEQRETALREGKVFLTITPGMHSTEVGGTQFGMQFAYELATNDEEPWKSARDNAVIILLPSLNPDGLDHVCEWYRRTVNTPYESASMLKLYQYYTGHDNNRDFYMLAQAETKILSRLLYHDWRPQVHWDVHQQGNSGERMFVPPFRDPLNPNLDPAMVSAVNLIGMRAVLDMTREGLTGIATGVKYENWAGGTNRSVPARHNIVAILTEAASASIASPVFQKRGDLKPVYGQSYGPSNQYVNPWPGGWWRIGDIINYELAFGRSLLGTINREPRLWLSSVMEANLRSIEKGRGDGVRGWIIPADERDIAAVKRLSESLMGAGVEMHVSEGELTLDGRSYPPGSIIIRRDQPWGTYVNDLFEIQRYPQGYQPYDVAGWTVPLLMGVRRAEVMQAVDELNLKRVESGADAVAMFAGDPRVNNAGKGALSAADSASWTHVAQRVQQGEALAFVTQGDAAGLFLPGDAPRLAPPLATGAESKDTNAIVISRLPRIGIYSPWTGIMDEGWLRWVFDTWKIPFVTVKNEQLRAGRLSDFIDVLIIPGMTASTIDEGRPHGSVHEQYARGLAPEGTVAIQDFVRGGGTLITFASASKWAIDQFELPLSDVTSGARSTTQPTEGFYCPGSVLRSVPEAHRLTAGLPQSLPMMFASSAAWRTTSKSGEEKVETLLRYAKTELLLSGYINKPQTIAGHSAWVRATVGDGRVHLFAFQPHYRSWSQACFGLIFRAAMLDARAGQ